MELYIAEVIKNDDMSAFPYPGREGRVQIYVEHMMSDWSENYYPWARPFLGNSNLYGDLHIPEEDSYVWVFCIQEELKQNWFYISYVTFKKKNIIEKVLSFINGKFKLSPSAGGLGLSSSYPDVKLSYFKNGIVVGVSSSESNPEVFIYHPEALISIDKSGNISSKGKKWTHYGDIEIKEGELKVDKEITAMNASDSTKVTLSKHQHISGSPGSLTATPKPGA